MMVKESVLQTIVLFAFLAIQSCVSRSGNNENSFHVNYGKNCHWKTTNDQEFISLSQQIRSCSNNAVRQDSYPLAEPNQWFDVECEENSGFLSLSEASNSMKRLVETAKASGSNMHISVFGDSVMTQQMFHLACMISSSIQMHIIEEDGFKVFEIIIENVKIRHYPFSYLHHVDHNVGQVLHKFVTKHLLHASPWDVLVFNFGLFVNEATQFQPYETLVSQIVQTYEVAKATADKEEKKLPLTIWRETTPQHFPSTNGWFDKLCPFGHGQCHCVPSITNAMRNGSSIPVSASFDTSAEKMCRPVCTSAATRNTIADTVIRREQSIHINHIYAALEAATFDLHYTNEDCTHLRQLPLNFMNRVLLSTILKTYAT